MGQTIYTNGCIITMRDSQPTVEALLVEDGIIKAAGSLEEVTKAAQIDAQRIDLAGRTLLPGFIDSHSHIINFSQLLSTVALQGVQTPEALQQKLRDYIAKAQLPEGSWIIGFGYDHNLWPEKKQPDRHLLDQISDKYPLMLAHQSGHMGVVNTLALEQLGITMADKDPAGGRIGRENGELTGYFEENAFSALSQKIPHPSLAQQKQWMKQAEETYLRFGVTTAQEGKMEPEQLELMHQLTKEEKLLLDIVGYLDMQQAEQMSITGQPFWQQYINGFKIGGYKIFLDGSPQGRTAWLTQPYEPQEEGYYGYPIYENAEVEALVGRAFAEKRQILAHCNGDAAADQFLQAIQAARKVYGDKGDLRPVMIHAQLVRPDRIVQMAQLGVIPSYFAAHTYHWGDAHLRNLGPKRAMVISPLASTVKQGIALTMHQDTPVILPNMLETIWCAVSRTTREGFKLSQEERLTPWQALKAVTINGAYQYFEEARKGKLEPGKLADMVILSDNPLTVETDKIKEIKVLATIKEGQVVFGTI